MDQRTKIQYCVWIPEIKDENGEITDGGYFNDYDRLEDAVDSNGGKDVEIFWYKPKRLGVYSLQRTYIAKPEPKSKKK